MMRWDPPLEANGIAVISSRTFPCARAVAGRGYVLHPIEPLLRIEVPRVAGSCRILRRSVIFVDSTGRIVKSYRH